MEKSVTIIPPSESKPNILRVAAYCLTAGSVPTLIIKRHPMPPRSAATPS